MFRIVPHSSLVWFAYICDQDNCSRQEFDRSIEHYITHRTPHQSLTFPLCKNKLIIVTPGAAKRRGDGRTEVLRQCGPWKWPSAPQAAVPGLYRTVRERTTGQIARRWSSHEYWATLWDTVESGTKRERTASGVLRSFRAFKFVFDHGALQCLQFYASWDFLRWN